MSLPDFLEYQETFKDSILKEVEIMLPAKIYSYNHSNKTAEIEVMVKWEDKDGNYINIPIVPNISVSFPIFNDFCISYPLKKNDLGRLCIFSKDVDRYKKFGGKQNDIIKTLFSCHNSIFVPDFQPSNTEFNYSSADNMVIGRIDGGLIIELTPNNEIQIKQASNDRIILNTDGTINFTPNDNIDIEFNKDKEIIVILDSIPVFKINSDKSITIISSGLTLTNTGNINIVNSGIINITSPNININAIMAINGATFITGALGCSTGWTGTFPTNDGRTVTVLAGIITNCG